MQVEKPKAFPENFVSISFFLFRSSRNVVVHVEASSALSETQRPSDAMSASRRGLDRDGYAYVPPRDDGLAGTDAWDDSALMDAYNNAVERYKVNHGLGAGSAKSGAGRVALSPSVGGSRPHPGASPSPSRGSVASGTPRSSYPQTLSPAPPRRRSPLPGNPQAASAPDPRASPSHQGDESRSWDAYYAHHATHTQASPTQQEYYDPYYGYDAPHQAHPHPHPHDPRRGGGHRRPETHSHFPGFHGAPPAPYGPQAYPPGPYAPPRPPYGPPGPYGGHPGMPPPPHHPPRRSPMPPAPPLGGDLGQSARMAAAAALDSGAAGDYQGNHPDEDVDELANLLMSWYYAGYYTGQYSKRGGGEAEEAGESDAY